MNKKEIFQIWILIESEYPGFIPPEKKDAEDEEANIRNVKMINWHEQLKDFDYVNVQGAIKQMMRNKAYGVPKLSDLFDILMPQPKNINLGSEFASDVWNWCARPGVEAMAYNVQEKYGEPGMIVYERNKTNLREALMDQAETIKAQLRNEFNSVAEREKLKLDTLGNKLVAIENAE